ncbi:MAG TPA: SRPBCC domain-containing protein [Devosiaceae bacterium]|jgi:uncharacterized protein YndB with AHSA1/START domain|nr:SRPBCC domain-containing protein [Devosiaceae bacterium]
MTTTDDGSGTIRISREFPAPAALLFRQWTEIESLREWFAPDGYEVTLAEADARPGGHWRVDYRSADGSSITEAGRYERLQPPVALAFTLQHRFGDGSLGPETRVSVTFTELGDRTRMEFSQSGILSPQMRDGYRSGWGSCFDKLEAHNTAACGNRQEAIHAQHGS